MKYAIAADGDNMDSLVSDKGGRAPFYLSFEDSKLIDSIKNPFAVGGGGAGFSVAYMLAEKNIEKLFAPELGGNMINALAERGVMYEKVKFGEKISDIVKKNLE